MTALPLSFRRYIQPLLLYMGKEVRTRAAREKKVKGDRREEKEGL